MHFDQEIINDVKVAVEIKSDWFVVEISASFAKLNDDLNLLHNNIYAFSISNLLSFIPSWYFSFTHKNVFSSRIFITWNSFPDLISIIQDKYPNQIQYPIWLQLFVFFRKVFEEVVF